MLWLCLGPCLKLPFLWVGFPCVESSLRATCKSLYEYLLLLPTPKLNLSPELCSKRITVFVRVPCLEGLGFDIRPDGQILLLCLQPDPDDLGYCE